jgi:drug/metabolite transporter (DMT)-like permease
MGTLHRTVGFVGIVVFLLTGVYLRRHVPPLPELDNGARMLFRSRHIYILLASLVNLAIGINYQPMLGRYRRRFQAVGSCLLLAAVLLLILAFCIEAPRAQLDGKLAPLGIVCLLVGTLCQTGGAPSRLRPSESCGH